MIPARRNAWIFLMFAITLEVLGVSMLEGIPAILGKYTDKDYLSIFGYDISFSIIAKINMLFMITISYYCMSLALRNIALGVAYSTWEIVGLIGVLLISFLFFEPSLTLQQYIGIAVGFVGIVCVILGEEH